MVAPLTFTAELTQSWTTIFVLVHHRLGHLFHLVTQFKNFLWARPACPSQIIISASGNTSLTALAEEESASCQWMATCIPSSLALRNVRRAAYPSADLDVPLYNSSSITLSMIIEESPIQMVNVAFLLCQPRVCHVPSATVTARFHDPSSSSFLSFSITLSMIIEESPIQMVNVAFLLCQPRVCHVPSATVTARFHDPSSSSFLSFIYCLAASQISSSIDFTTGYM